jgi:hypothetical protein
MSTITAYEYPGVISGIRVLGSESDMEGKAKL